MSSPNSNSSSKCGTLDAINSTSFDPDQYMHLLVHRSNLEGLLQRHVEMAAEIKNLDTDLQIMKSNIVGMEANMEQLLEKIMSVRSRSAGVNTRLFEKREHATFFVKFWHQLIRRISIDFFPSCWELPLPCSLLCLPSLSSYANIHVPLYSC
ncbi:vacuolar protein sorting-associated protein 51 homolog isoform X2 [Malus domestica]|uniref:vacuolar protein sorting-associated protein 51 homolog isoform X2 n=1 Tax=Malus domestica TaxID=3750 RepID=UPI0007ECD034|nr:vacuolar protein sorting-associated protein 51 homolog isoform X2 [Malus domestica]